MRLIPSCQALSGSGLTLLEAVLAIVAAMFFCIFAAKNVFNMKQAEVLRDRVIVLEQEIRDCGVESANLKILLNHGRKAE